MVRGVGGVEWRLVRGKDLDVHLHGSLNGHISARCLLGNLPWNVSSNRSRSLPMASSTYQSARFISRHWLHCPYLQMQPKLKVRPISDEFAWRLRIDMASSQSGSSRRSIGPIWSTVLLVCLGATGNMGLGRSQDIITSPCGMEDVVRQRSGRKIASSTPPAIAGMWSRRSVQKRGGAVLEELCGKAAVFEM
jgi:hypothetical protein